MAVKFPLQMTDGSEVRNLNDLQEHFDLTSVMKYLRDGRLLTWLDDHGYGSEGDKVNTIDADAPDAGKKLCEALGVPYEENDNTEKAARLQEKRRLLREITSNESIIANADKTAMNREDLADLVNSGARLVYLCGKEFSISLRKPDVKYVGILGKPRILVNANSQEELDAKGIVVENATLPWKETVSSEKQYQSSGKEFQPTATSSSRKNELREIFEEIFKCSNTWGIVDKDGTLTSEEPGNAQKRLFLKMLGIESSDEIKLIHARVADDRSVGWALTESSFYVGGDLYLIGEQWNDVVRNSNHILMSENDIDIQSIPDAIDPLTGRINTFVLDEYVSHNPNIKKIEDIDGIATNGMYRKSIVYEDIKSSEFIKAKCHSDNILMSSRNEGQFAITTIDGDSLRLTGKLLNEYSFLGDMENLSEEQLVSVFAQLHQSPSFDFMENPGERMNPEEIIRMRNIAGKNILRKLSEFLNYVCQ